MPPTWSRRIPFKVDVAGVIRVMGQSLYSRPAAAVRELLQNGHDAVARRRIADLAYRGRIDLTQDAAAGTLTVADDGVGLTEAEAERYLGTLGIGITGLLRRDPGTPAVDADALIGQFGVGLFSGFLLADRIDVHTRKADGSPPVRWSAGPGTDIKLSSGDRAGAGTAVTLHLRPEHLGVARDEQPLLDLVREFADFLPVPIFVNGGAARANRVHAAWFDPTPDAEAIELELVDFFGESPLDVLAVHVSEPTTVHGALYVTPARTPGFSGEAVVTATVRRMVISRDIRGLLPGWASFVRGVLELNGCSPTASREDLVRDEPFAAARAAVESALFAHLEQLVDADPTRLAGIVAWHRYALAGAAVAHARLRAVLRRAYTFGTTRGPLPFDAILAASGADPLVESDASHVVWFNVDRRQERWAEQAFAGHDGVCVHAVRTFEESLLAAFAADAVRAGTADRVDLRPAVASSPGFARSVLNVTDMADADEAWQRFLAVAGVKAFVAAFDPAVPVLAFLNERRELAQTFDDLRKTGQVPAGFQRLIDSHLATGTGPTLNEVVLNRRHPLVNRALGGTTSHPLASVLRVLVMNALSTAGATVPADARRAQGQDLEWVADVLWTRAKQAGT